MTQRLKLGPENVQYDNAAKSLYNLHRNEWGKPKKGWPPFEGLSRKVRDYWRMLVLTAE